MFAIFTRANIIGTSANTPRKEKIIIRARSRSVIAMLSNFFRNSFSKYSMLFFLIINFLVKYPVISGITTKGIVDNISVS